MGLFIARFFVVALIEMTLKLCSVLFKLGSHFYNRCSALNFLNCRPRHRKVKLINLTIHTTFLLTFIISFFTHHITCQRISKNVNERASECHYLCCTKYSFLWFSWWYTLCRRRERGSETYTQQCEKFHNGNKKNSSFSSLSDFKCNQGSYDDCEIWKE